ncbi:MAG: hypothetical protein ABSE72_10560 [Bacteroidales bacterium]
MRIAQPFVCNARQKGNQDLRYCRMIILPMMKINPISIIHGKKNNFSNKKMNQDKGTKEGRTSKRE